MLIVCMEGIIAYWGLLARLEWFAPDTSDGPSNLEFVDPTFLNKILEMGSDVDRLTSFVKWHSGHQQALCWYKWQKSQVNYTLIDISVKGQKLPKQRHTGGHTLVWRYRTPPKDFEKTALHQHYDRIFWRLETFHKYSFQNSGYR